ncbi:PadR family transcriptional regulator [Allorhizocola rhizosphaerae]|uniref:PadR family transcriptional regulator n=1 Tax=Allorhizocola rhizosphaerae TaxID=1872709 RepID=UPI000E3BD263|nr:PadR family transcriptional regulator [Allorhizocola rhizosphaerae]
MLRNHLREHRRRAFGFDPGWERGHRHGHGRGRGRRGDTRAAVLGLLVERPMHGYEMISELEQRTGGVWRPSPGSIYPTLQLLEDEGLIVSEQSEGRKRFTLTDAGRAEAEGAERPWRGLDESRISEMQAFREAGFGIMQALRQVGMTGNDDQRRQALEVLNETKRKLYAILAAE